jgi:MoaA/NifB/PqqE/SkfB family radical SAM enzyme
MAPEQDRAALEALIQTGRLQEAMTALKDVARSSSSPWEAYLWLAKIHERRGALAQAERALRQILALDRQSTPAKLELARFLERNGRAKEAQAIAEEILEVEDDIEARIVLGCVHDKLGHPKEASRHFRRVLKAKDRLPPEKSLWLEQRLLHLRKRLDALPRRKRIRRWSCSRRTAAAAAVNGKLLVIDATTRCNQTCVFCFERSSHFSRPDLTFEWIKKAVLRAKRGGYKRILFMGGEATLCRWLIPAVEFIQDQGLSPSITTNGVVLASARFTRRLMAAGIDSIEISLLSHIADDDYRAGGLKGGWGLRRKALENIRQFRPLGARGFKLCANIVLTSTNTRYLSEMVRSLSGFGIERFKLKMMHVTKNIQDPGIVPRFSALRAELHRTMRYMEKGGLDFSFEDVPLCQLDPKLYARQIAKDDLGGVGFAYGTDASARRRPFLTVVHGSSDKCRTCSVRPYCCEPQKAYVDLFGDGEFNPQ